MIVHVLMLDGPLFSSVTGKLANSCTHTLQCHMDVFKVLLECSFCLQKEAERRQGEGRGSDTREDGEKHEKEGGKNK